MYFFYQPCIWIYSCYNAKGKAQVFNPTATRIKIHSSDSLIHSHNTYMRARRKHIGLFRKQCFAASGSTGAIILMHALAIGTEVIPFCPWAGNEGARPKSETCMLRFSFELPQSFPQMKTEPLVETCKRNSTFQVSHVYLRYFPVIPKIILRRQNPDCIFSSIKSFLSYQSFSSSVSLR